MKPLKIKPLSAHLFCDVVSVHGEVCTPPSTLCISGNRYSMKLKLTPMKLKEGQETGDDSHVTEIYFTDFSMGYSITEKWDHHSTIVDKLVSL